MRRKYAQERFYDLSSGEKLEELRFAEPVAYTHFSGDGQKLLVLTDNQEVFVLDVSQVRAAHPSAQPVS